MVRRLGILVRDRSYIYLLVDFTAYDEVNEASRGVEMLLEFFVLSRRWKHASATHRTLMSVKIHPRHRERVGAGVTLP